MGNTCCTHSGSDHHHYHHKTNQSNNSDNDDVIVNASSHHHTNKNHRKLKPSGSQASFDGCASMASTLTPPPLDAVEGSAGDPSSTNSIRFTHLFSPNDGTTSSNSSANNNNNNNNNNKTPQSPAVMSPTSEDVRRFSAHLLNLMNIQMVESITDYSAASDADAEQFFEDHGVDLHMLWQQFSAVETASSSALHRGSMVAHGTAAAATAAPYYDTSTASRSEGECTTSSSYRAMSIASQASLMSAAQVLRTMVTTAASLQHSTTSGSGSGSGGRTTMTPRRGNRGGHQHQFHHHLSQNDLSQH
eukprot:PhM_4_TR10351/c2_g1_i3/m.59932